MDNKYEINDELDYEKLEANAQVLSGVNYVPLPAPKKQLGLKITSAILYALITVVAFPLDIAFLIDTIININKETENWEGLGVGIGLAVVLIATIIVTAVAVLLYQVVGVLCITGFCLSFTKTKLKGKRLGKIWFPVQGLLVVISEILLIILMVAVILIIALAK